MRNKTKVKEKFICDCGNEIPPLCYCKKCKKGWFGDKKVITDLEDKSERNHHPDCEWFNDEKCDCDKDYDIPTKVKEEWGETNVPFTAKGTTPIKAKHWFSKEESNFISTLLHTAVKEDREKITKAIINHADEVDWDPRALANVLEVVKNL